MNLYLFKTFIFQNSKVIFRFLFYSFFKVVNQTIFFSFIFVGLIISFFELLILSPELLQRRLPGLCPLNQLNIRTRLEHWLLHFLAVRALCALRHLVGIADLADHIMECLGHFLRFATQEEGWYLKNI